MKAIDFLIPLCYHKRYPIWLFWVCAANYTLNIYLMSCRYVPHGGHYWVGRIAVYIMCTISCLSSISIAVKHIRLTQEEEVNETIQELAK